jgi:hypothetical protein
MKRLSRGQELLAGFALSAFLLLFAVEAWIVVSAHGLGGLSGDSRQVFIDVGGFLGVIGGTDMPQRIRSSRFLRFQTLALSFMLILLGFGPEFLRYLPETHRFERWSVFFILGACSLVVVFSIAILLYQYITTYNTADS